MKLPFVIKGDKYLDLFSNHKHGIAFMLDKPESSEVYDVTEDKKLTIKEYLKTQQ